MKKILQTHVVMESADVAMNARSNQMNNRYLYRAKLKNSVANGEDAGKWVEGHLITDEKNKDKYFIGYVFGTDDDGTPHDFDVAAVDPSTICQCTGKHDIPENKMIYEHDFVSFLDTYSTENGYAEQYCIGEVLWDDEELCFYVTNRLSAESYEVLDDCKVIGNRFDNPELLEV